MRKIVTHANVFDGRQEQLKENAYVAIEEGKVLEIGQGEVSLEGFGEVIDAGGRTVIPGLIDSHAHVCNTAPIPVMDTMREDEVVLRAARYAEEMLLRGFTTVRDAGGATVGLKTCIDNGFLKGPRIFPSLGSISQTCGHADVRVYRSQRTTPYGSTSALMRTGIYIVADGAAEVQKTCREQLFLGASQVKIMAGGGMGSYFDPLVTLQYTYEEIKAAVDVATDYGTYVMAHLYTPEQMKRAAKAGVKSFEHATLLDDETARIVRDNGIWLCICPQFGGSGGSVVKQSGPMPVPFGTPCGKPKTPLAVMKEGLERQAELINKYRLPIVFGTDAFRAEKVDEEPEDRQITDLRNYKKFFGSFEGLKAITGNAYELYKMCTYQNPYPDGKVGVLEEGSFADLCIVEGNPVADLEVLCDHANMKLVMKGGQVYRDVR